MESALQRYLEAVNGLTALTRANAERIVRQMVRQGEVASEQVADRVQDMLERSQRNRDLLTTLVGSEVQRAVRTMGLATNDEVLSLRKQVADLKREVAGLRADAQEGDA